MKIFLHPKWEKEVNPIKVFIVDSKDITDVISSSGNDDYAGSLVYTSLKNIGLRVRPCQESVNHVKALIENSKQKNTLPNAYFVVLVIVLFMIICRVFSFIVEMAPYFHIGL